MTAADGAATGRPPRPSRMRLWIAGAGLTACVLIVLCVTLSPIPVDRGYEGAISTVLRALHRHGIPEWFGYRKLEFAANVAMFLPVGFFLTLALRRRRIWWAIVALPVLSLLLEGAQGVFLPERYASALDVVANTVGGYVGACLAIALRAVVARRDEVVIARAAWEARCPT